MDDIKVTLLRDGAEKTFKLRHSFKAICQIEDATGKSCARLIADGLAESESGATTIRYRLGVKDTVIILTAGMRAADEPANADAVGAMVLETGLGALTDPVLAYLMRYVVGSAKADDAETEPPQAEPTDPAPAEAVEGAPAT